MQHKASTSSLDARPHTFERFPEDEVNQSILERFEKQVARHADRLAVCDGRETLTYDQLNRRANRIARAVLRACPLEPASRVAILLPKDARYIAAIFGVLKGGHALCAPGSSVPLQPERSRGGRFEICPNHHRRGERRLCEGARW